VQWLLTSREPAIRHLARRDLLGEDAAADSEDILGGSIVAALLSGQRQDGGFGCHPYAKWGGSFWRVISLVELGIPSGESRTVAAARDALTWVTGPARSRSPQLINGRVRQHAAGEGFMLAVLCRLGLAGEPVAADLADRLVTWQWPDGGWNCDPRPAASRSSFHESFAPAWGLWEYSVATNDGAARAAAGRTAELLLSHRLVRSRRTGEVVHPSWTKLHWPAYWHYDVLAGLSLLARVGALGDERAGEALDLLEQRRRPDGRWEPGGSWWKPPGSNGSNVEVVDWGRRAPNEMITLQALRVQRAAAG